MNRPIRFGVVGMGGYAGSLLKRFFDPKLMPADVGVLTVACDPQPSLFPEFVKKLEARKIPIVHSIQEVLKTDIDAVWLPVPIHLHRPFAEMSLAAGKPVMCEKPAAGCIEDVDAMIAARDKYKLPFLIGFQDVYRPQMRKLKDRILSGEFGKPLAAAVMGVAPRGSVYYGRNKWAGAMKREGVWVLDSPANNAIAHLIHLTIFLLGKEKLKTAQAKFVEAELYRANAIENFDTCSIRVTVDNHDAPITIAMTHAASPKGKEVWDVELRFEKATVRYIRQAKLEIERDGKIESVSTEDYPHAEMVDAMRQATAGGTGDTIVGTLEMARMHTLVINGVASCAPIRNIPDEFVEVIPVGKDKTDLVRSVKNIGASLVDSARAGKLLSEAGGIPWASKGGSADLLKMKTFAGPVSG